LNINHLLVAACNELVVLPNVYDLMVVHHHDLVRVSDGAIYTREGRGVGRSVVLVVLAVLVVLGVGDRVGAGVGNGEARCVLRIFVTSLTGAPYLSRCATTMTVRPSMRRSIAS